MEGITPWMETLRVHLFEAFLKRKEGVKGRSHDRVEFIAVSGGFRCVRSSAIVSIDGLEDPALILAGRP
jgi:hypothetical protein